MDLETDEQYLTEKTEREALDKMGTETIAAGDTSVNAMSSRNLQRVPALDDSAYDMMSDSFTLTSEETDNDGTTVSLASFDDDTLEDISSGAGTDMSVVNINNDAALPIGDDSYTAQGWSKTGQEGSELRNQGSDYDTEPEDIVNISGNESHQTVRPDYDRGHVEGERLPTSKIDARRYHEHRAAIDYRYDTQTKLPGLDSFWERIHCTYTVQCHTLDADTSSFYTLPSPGHVVFVGRIAPAGRQKVLRKLFRTFEGHFDTGGAQDSISEDDGTTKDDWSTNDNVRPEEDVSSGDVATTKEDAGTQGDVITIIDERTKPSLPLIEEPKPEDFWLPVSADAVADIEISPLEEKNGTQPVATSQSDMFEPKLFVFLHKTPTKYKCGYVSAKSRQMTTMRDVARKCQIPILDLYESVNCEASPPIHFDHLPGELVAFVERESNKRDSIPAVFVPISIGQFAYEMQHSTLRDYLRWLFAQKNTHRVRLRRKRPATERLASFIKTTSPALRRHSPLPPLILLLSILIPLCGYFLWQRSSGNISIDGRAPHEVSRTSGPHPTILSSPSSAFPVKSTVYSSIPTLVRRIYTSPSSAPALDIDYKKGSQVEAPHHSSLETGCQRDLKIAKVGCCSLLLARCSKPTRSKPSRGLLMELIRGTKRVDAELLQVADGIYLIHLPWHEAHGMLKIRVLLPSKTAEHQELTVDLSRRWLVALSWSKMAFEASRNVSIKLDSVLTSTGSTLLKLRHGILKGSQSALKLATEHSRIHFRMLHIHAKYLQGFLSHAARSCTFPTQIRISTLWDYTMTVLNRRQTELSQIIAVKSIRQRQLPPEWKNIRFNLFDGSRMRRPMPPKLHTNPLISKARQKALRISSELFPAVRRVYQSILGKYWSSR